ncbi:MAG: GGDEF domain-containing protein, partial [Actinobacteria bacterium]|nr:GGDEF domain-containing protein [Actinomycetota bacterium]
MSSSLPPRGNLAYWTPLVTIFVVAALVVSGRYFQEKTTEIYRQRAEVISNVDRMKHLDVALTDSARLAAATGNPAYERRWLTLAPKIEHALEATVRLVGSPEAQRNLAQAEASTRALIGIEERAFELVRSGRSLKAQALLDGARYSREKSLYAASSARAYRSFLDRSEAKTRVVDQQSLMALLISLMGAIILLVVGGFQVRLSRAHKRVTAENERSRNIETHRAAAERDYHASQREFTEIMQITRNEDEAHALLKRHLERTLEGSEVLVLNRNNSDDRLEPTTELPAGSALIDRLEGAKPDSCLAIRLGKTHERGQDQETLLSCELCEVAGATSTCVPSLVGGEMIGAVLVQHPSPLDSDEKRRVEESLAQASPVLANLRNLALSQTRALTDGLTGLPNRRSIDDTLKRMSAQAIRTATPLAVVLFDLDHFKQINDVFGHDKGDEVLAAVAAVIESGVRGSDFAGRHGGEEFILLLPDTDRDSARAVADKLRQSIAAVEVTGVSRPITASFGVAALPDDATEPTLLLRAADRALYLAKTRGRNRVETLAVEEP